MIGEGFFCLCCPWWQYVWIKKIIFGSLGLKISLKFFFQISNQYFFFFLPLVKYNTVGFSRFKRSIWLILLTVTVRPVLIWPQAATDLLSVTVVICSLLCLTSFAWHNVFEIHLFVCVSSFFLIGWVVFHIVNLAQLGYPFISWWMFGFQF